VGESLSVKAREHQLDLVLSIPPDLPRVPGDGDRLAQVFTNLLDNAIKHTPAGGSVTLSATATRDGVTVTVRDTGEGIPPEDLSRIFERFYQVDKSSTVGQGSTFTVWLPLKAAF
jgi:signal transduction histidine kinase